MANARVKVTQTALDALHGMPQDTFIRFAEFVETRLDRVVDTHPPGKIPGLKGDYWVVPLGDKDSAVTGAPLVVMTKRDDAVVVTAVVAPDSPESTDAAIEAAIVDNAIANIAP